MGKSPQTTMASITTITTKQYEFCDDVKKHILSFLAPKKMSLVNLYDDKIQALLMKCQRPDRLFSRKARIYHLRMLVSKEQIDYERSDVGIKHRKKQLAAVKIASDRKLVIIDLENYWRLRRNGGTGEILLPLWNDYASYSEFLYYPYKALILGTEYERYRRSHSPYTPLQEHLSHIMCYGKRYAERADVRFKKAKQAEARREKAKEKIACECGCGKTLARSTVSRHKTLRAQGR